MTTSFKKIVGNKNSEEVADFFREDFYRQTLMICHQCGQTIGTHYHLLKKKDLSENDGINKIFCSHLCRSEYLQNMEDICFEDLMKLNLVTEQQELNSHKELAQSFMVKLIPLDMEQTSVCSSNDETAFCFGFHRDSDTHKWKKPTIKSILQ